MNGKVENGKYSAVKVGGFRLGDFNSKAAAKKAIKNWGEYGFYQIIDNWTHYAIWEGYNRKS
jgi:hypothetical protein